MAEVRLSTRETNTSQVKGSLSTQSYLGTTVKNTTTTAGTGTENREQVGQSVQETESASGNILETRTSSGLSKSSAQAEDKGLQIKFSIPIQQRNPIQRQA